MLRTLAEAAIRDSQTTAAIEKLLLVPSFLDYASFEKKVASDSAFHLNVLRQLGAV